MATTSDVADKTVRIGCASAFYGDSQLSARQLVERGDIDYLVFDYLAESTMAILSQARAKDASLGYAVDFVTVAMRDVLADCAKKGIRIIANAAGVNAPACLAALRALCRELGLDLKISAVYGDDLASRAVEWDPAELAEIRSGEPLPPCLASINAYLGAAPIADALAAGADVVVTGRVVDSAVALGPLMHEFGWLAADFDRLAQGSLAGHVIECGAQCTGGNFTDWYLVPDFSNMSYPIAEVSEDGTFVIEIPRDTGGIATPGTVGEQILYEIGDPANYLLPDVVCDFSHIRLEQIGDNRVRVSGARGRAPGPQYKVCATWIDGFRLTGSFFMAGPRAAEKARRSLEAWISRTRRVFAGRGLGDYRQVCIEIIGAEDTYGAHARTKDTREVMGKYGLHHDNREALRFAAAEMAYLATSATPGMSGFGAARAQPQPLMRIHSTLINKDRVPVTVQIGDEVVVERCYVGGETSVPTPKCQTTVMPPDTSGAWTDVPLEKLVFARSGDKGNDANVGVMCRRPEYYALLHRKLTSDVVADYFDHLVDGTVERFELPGFHAFNFLMTDALGGGATASLRVDAQGKAFAQMLLSMNMRVPAAWVS